MLRPRQYVYKTPLRIRKPKRARGFRAASWWRSFRRFILGLVLLAFDAGAVGWFSYKAWDILCADPSFMVSRIHVQGSKIFTHDQIIGKSRLGLQKNIFKANIRDAKRILEEEPLLKKVEVWRQLPDQIFITIVEREPQAQIVSFDDSTKAWLIDPDGVILSESQEPNSLYPLIRFKIEKKDFHRGKRLADKGLLNALSVLEVFSQSVIKKMLDLEVLEVPDEFDVVLKSKSGLVVHLGYRDFEERLIKLLSIIEDLNRKKQVPESIDLRFRDVPVVLKEHQTQKA